MMTINRRSDGAWQIERGQVQGVGRASAARWATIVIQHEQVNRWRVAARALAIIVGLLSGGQSFAEESLLLNGALPQVNFSDNFAPTQAWSIYANSEGFDVFNNTLNRTPFGIDPTALNLSLIVGTNGQIGFGTNNPQSHLHVQTSDFSPTLRLESTFAGFEHTWDLETSAFGVVLRDVSNLGSTPFGVAAGAPTNSLFVATNGSVGLGTAAPQVIGNTAAVGQLINVRSDTSNSRFVLQGQAGGLMEMVDLSAAADRKIFRIFNRSGFTRFQVVKDDLAAFTVNNVMVIDNSNGNFGLKVASPLHPLHLASGARCTAGGVFTNASSRELKQDIEPISSEQARDTVRALQPVGYRYKHELDERYVGFIAEDVPELVATRDRKALAPMDITAVLTKVVQDQDRQLDEQRQTLAQQQKLITQQQESLTSQQATMAALAKRLADLEEKLSGTGAASR